MSKDNHSGLIMIGSAVVAGLLVAVLLIQKGSEPQRVLPSSAEVAKQLWPAARLVVAPRAALPAAKPEPAVVPPPPADKPKPKAATATMTQPVSPAKTKVVASSASRARGEHLFDTVCFMCHGTGAAGAPVMGDKGAWKARIAKGDAALLKSATVGMAGMPPKGTCGDCTTDDLKAAIAYMVGNSR